MMYRREFATAAASTSWLVVCNPEHGIDDANVVAQINATLR